MYVFQNEFFGLPDLLNLLNRVYNLLRDVFRIDSNIYDKAFLRTQFIAKRH